jgi:2-dehydropantoate 2-reductase
MRIAIFGAGSIGCMIGGSLIADGHEVVLIGRQQIGDEIAQYGLTVSDLEGRSKTLDASKVNYTIDPSALKGIDCILLTVKCTDTLEAAKTIAAHASSKSVIYSFQNGIGNVAILEKELKGMDVVAAVVAFNVLWMKNAHFHRSTDAGIVLGRHPASHELARNLRLAHIPTIISPKMDEVAWGKLCLNLNNAINVLSDLPLKQQLAERSYRKVLAAAIEEALAVMKAKKINPSKVGKVSPKYIPSILNLPDPVFKMVTGSMMKMDDTARSSMWEDLQKNRASEIDYLNGAVVDAGLRLKVPTPVNQAIITLVKQAFEEKRSPQLSGEQLLERVGL